MEVTVIIILLYIAIFIFDFVPTIKKKNKNEIWFYGVAFFASFIALMLSSFDISIPFEIY